MLEQVMVRDFALIEEASFDLGTGFTAFTGETGAGKSLVVGALGFLLGGRSDSSTIRQGADECSVSAVFDVSDNPKAQGWLAARDLHDEGGRATLRRGLRANGRSYAYIQGSAVTRTDLEEFAELLADIHGQHEHQSLLDEARHLDYLDGFAGLGGRKDEYRRAYDSWTALAREYRRRAEEAARRKSEEESLSYRVKEIRALKIRKGEDEALAREEKILGQHEKLFAALKGAVEALGGGSGEQGACQALKRSCSEARSAAEIDSSLADLVARIDSARLELEDVEVALASRLEGLRFDPERLEEVLGRLAELRRVMKKYGPSLDEVLERARRDEELLGAFDAWEEERPRLELELSARRSEVLAQAEALSEARQEAGRRLSSRVEAILVELGMPGSRFEVGILTRKNEAGKTVLGPEGKDEVFFLIAPNLGEPAKPLAKIASGGELSRIALAIRVVLASVGSASTLVFDEIDTGIGGQVAVDVGSYLKELSVFKQVLCVTHLAVIAARADRQYRVEKLVVGARTETRISELDAASREGEIARMLSGDREGSLSLAHAAELLGRISS